MALLEVSGLSKQFGQIWAVRDLSFEVERGEIVVLLGPNGAGKTTTLRCIAGVLLPDEGQSASTAHPSCTIP
jgi:ABC-2 type transport system ATP-binding protein